MSTAVVLIALSGWLASPTPGEPTWLTDYGQARQQGREEGKPVAVFIGSGKAGWNDVSRDGRLRREARRLLAENYVCLYLDTDTKGGRRLASALEVSDGPGLVISSHSGQLQAFRHDGDLGDEDLTRYLTRYSDPDRVVQGTETARSARVSYYQPVSPPAVYYPAPVGFGGSRGFGGGGC
jgi:hypothetical protein